MRFSLPSFSVPTSECVRVCALSAMRKNQDMRVPLFTSSVLHSVRRTNDDYLHLPFLSIFQQHNRRRNHH